LIALIMGAIFIKFGLAPAIKVIFIVTKAVLPSVFIQTHNVLRK